MPRFLFVVPPLIGHIRPTIAVGAELLERGHAVAWAGDPSKLAKLLPDGAGLYEAGAVEIPDLQGLRGLEALKFLWDEGLIPLARTMRPEVALAIDAFKPDLAVVDQHALGGALASGDSDVPWVTSATTTAELVSPLDGLPKVKAWVQSRLDLLTGPDGDRGDLRFSDLLVLVYSSEQLVGGERRFPAHYAFVGPSLPRLPVTADFPWAWLDDRYRHVLVSLGTVTREDGRSFLRRVVQAFPDPDAGIRLVVVAPPGTFDTVPMHVLARPDVPQLALLPFMDAVVSHGGHNTVCESLSRGLPLVLAPIRDDQPTIAEQVVRAGAGVRVKYGRVTSDRLREAILGVLDDPSYRTAAGVLGASLAKAGGAGAAADRLERVLPDSVRVDQRRAILGRPRQNTLMRHRNGSRRVAHILLSNIPEHGHVNPTLAIVAELVRRGHRVSYPTTAEFAPRVTEAGAAPIIHRSTLPSGSSEDEWPADLSAGAALFLREALAVVPWQLVHFDEDRPDLVVHDVAALGARLLAHRWEIPAVQLSPSHVLPVSIYREFDRLYAYNDDWIAYRRRFRDFLDDHGLDMPVNEYLGAPDRCVVTIPRQFQLRPETLTNEYSFVGPCLRTGDSESSWDPPPPDRKVLYVSLGTCYANRPEFYRECIDAFTGLDRWHLVLSVGARVDPADLGDLPSNAEVHRSVPQLEVLRRASAFVTHGGMGSVLEALSYGVPLVVVPQGVDQPTNARRLAKLGLGTWLSPKHATAGALRDAVLAVSSAPDVAERLEEMRRAIAASGGAVAAADVIEESMPTAGWDLPISRREERPATSP